MLPHNWNSLGKVLTFKDKMVVVLLLLVATLAFVFWVRYFYINITNEVPKAGGEYTEGIVGQPIYVNPLLSQTSEADSDLAQIIYSGLFKYDNKGEIVPDLAESFELSEDKRIYTVHLRQGVLWHDGQSFTADDVYYTATILQDPMYKSPLRQNWQGVTAQIIDENTLSFELKNPYAGFIDSLTVGILPKHIWENISPEKFSLADYNLHPIGTGPYKFVDFQKDASGNILSYVLGVNKQYYISAPYISRITFNFYQDEDALLEAYNKKEIMGMSNIAPSKIGQLKNTKSTRINELTLPRYFGLFFNEIKSAALADEKVRSALSLATDRKEIIDTVLSGKGVPTYGPIFSNMKEYRDAGELAELNLEKANNILEEADWKKGDDGVRRKGNTELTFEIVTTDWPELSKTADILKTQFEKVGVKVDVKVLTVSDLQQNYIRPREYDALLFGQSISFNPDLYPYWHSSQKRDPGLNLSLFENKDADGLLESIRQESDVAKRVDQTQQLQKILADEKPATFLYSPLYLYPTSTTLHTGEIGNVIVPAQRFSQINTWYVKTKRIFK